MSVYIKSLLHIKGLLRKAILFPTNPGIREREFAIMCLHREIIEQQCSICKTTFWTIGEAKVCRKLSCYTRERGI